MLKNILHLASLVEMATGLALVFAPVLVIELLLGVAISGIGVPVARCFGIALLGLGLACLPRVPGFPGSAPPLLGMFIYNALIASLLVFLGTIDRIGGVLLWPALALHAVVAVSLLWARHHESRLGGAKA